MNPCKTKTFHQIIIATTQRYAKAKLQANGAMYMVSAHKRYCTGSVMNHDIDEINDEGLREVIDISESVSSSTNALKVTSNDYYSQYSDSFFTESYQKMMKTIENSDEFNPQCSLSKKFEETSLTPIESGVIKTPSSLLKIQLKITQEHLGDKKRIRLDEYLFRRLIFAVFHYTDKKEPNELMDPIQLRFRIFDSKARKRARQTLRKFRSEQKEQRMVEKESIFSPLTLTKMKLSRSMINRYTTEHGAIVNDSIHIYRPSFKLKLHDQITCFVSYSFLLEQYHKRIAQLFMDTLRQSKHDTFARKDDEDPDDESLNDDDEEDTQAEEDTAKQKEGDTRLKVYDIEREVSRIDAELSMRESSESREEEEEKDENTEEEEEEENYDESMDEQNEHNKELNALRSVAPRSVTNQHVFEWLQLIGQQIIPSETLITKRNIYTKEDIVLYEDDDLMVINKPPNIAVHPTFSTGCDFSNSLVNFLLYHCPELRDIQCAAIRSFGDGSFDDLLSQCTRIEDESDINLFYNHIQKSATHSDSDAFINSPLEDIMKPGIVHRIDKHTSGLLVVGKNAVACRFLQRQFAEHSIEREYLALTHNKLVKEMWTEENYIERHPIHRTQFHVMSQPQRSPFSLLTQDEVKDENIIRRKLGRMSYEEEEAMKKERAYEHIYGQSIGNKQQREMMARLKLLHDGDVNTNMLQEYQQMDAKPQRRQRDEFDVRQKRMGSAKLAVTHFRELETFEYVPKKQKKRHLFSLLNCKLGTGRTHQVRVHCHNIKIPIIGDNVYFVKEYKKYENELFDEITNFQEMHCHNIKIPIIGDNVYFVKEYKKYENELFDEITNFQEMHYLHAYLLKFKHLNGRIGQFTADPPEMFTKVLGRLRTLPIMAT
eukprot:977606_1